MSLLRVDLTLESVSPTVGLSVTYDTVRERREGAAPGDCTQRAPGRVVPQRPVGQYGRLQIAEAGSGNSRPLDAMRVHRFQFLNSFERSYVYVGVRRIRSQCSLPACRRYAGGLVPWVGGLVNRRLG